MPITHTRNLSTSSRHAFRVTAAAAILIFAACAQAQSTVVVINLNDSGAGSLRDAINNATPGETITFQPGLTGTIPLQSILSICNGQTLTIQGPGASQITVSGQKRVGVFNICSGTNVTISGLTIANGNPSERGAGMNHVGGMLQVRDSVISNNNAADFGGGINSDSGVLSIVNSTFSSNVAQVGGAVFVAGGY
jgi:predicted outer membrane repeat protein